MRTPPCPAMSDKQRSVASGCIPAPLSLWQWLQASRNASQQPPLTKNIARSRMAYVYTARRVPELHVSACFGTAEDHDLADSKPFVLTSWPTHREWVAPEGPQHNTGNQSWFPRSHTTKWQARKTISRTSWLFVTATQVREEDVRWQWQCYGSKKKQKITGTMVNTSRSGLVRSAAHGLVMTAFYLNMYKWQNSPFLSK